MLAKPATKWAALLLLAALLAGAGVGITNMRVYFSRELFITPGDPIQDDLAVADKWFANEGANITF